MSIYGPYMAHIWTYMAMYGHIWPYMVMYGHIWPYMAIYVHIYWQGLAVRLLADNLYWVKICQDATVINLNNGQATTV